MINITIYIPQFLLFRSSLFNIQTKTTKSCRICDTSKSMFHQSYTKGISVCLTNNIYRTLNIKLIKREKEPSQPSVMTQRERTEKKSMICDDREKTKKLIMVYSFELNTSYLNGLMLFLQQKLKSNTSDEPWLN